MHMTLRLFSRTRYGNEAALVSTPSSYMGADGCPLYLHSGIDVKLLIVCPPDSEDVEPSTFLLLFHHHHHQHDKAPGGSGVARCAQPAQGVRSPATDLIHAAEHRDLRGNFAPKLRGHGRSFGATQRGFGERVTTANRPRRETCSPTDGRDSCRDSRCLPTPRGSARRRMGAERGQEEELSALPETAVLLPGNDRHGNPELAAEEAHTLAGKKWRNVSLHECTCYPRDEMA